MTEKELHRLKRRELLQLLLAQSEELAEVQSQLEKTTEERDQLSETYERLRKRLDQKDAHIHGLRELLEAQRTKRQIEIGEAGNIAEAALRLNGIFEAAQKAADQYLYNIRTLAENGGHFPEEDVDPDSLMAEGDAPPMDDWNQDIAPLAAEDAVGGPAEAAYDTEGTQDSPAAGEPDQTEGHGT